MAATGLRRLFQWRMRTLLILMALVGFGLTFWNHYVQVYLTQEEAAESLKQFSAQIKSDPAPLEFLAPLVGKERYHCIVECRLTGYNVDDEGVSVVANMPYLERLYLATTRVGDEGAKSIAMLRNLRRLSLWRTRITDEGLALLARCRRLQVLDLHDTCVTDEGLAAIATMRNLRFLKLGGPVHGPGLTQVAKLPKLRELDLSDSAVGYEDLRYLRGSRIEELHLARMLPASVVPDLITMPHLRELNGQIVQATDNEVAALSDCRKLQSLSVSGLGVTDKSMRYIQRLEGLSQLTLHGDLTDRTLQAIADMKQLDTIRIKGRFSRAAIEKLASERPSLGGVIHTLLPSPSYEKTPETIGGLVLKPLIEFSASRYGQRRIMGLQENRTLSAWVHWPATLADAAKLDAYRERIFAMWMVDPNSLRRTGYQANWSLKGLDKFSYLGEFHASRIARDEPMSFVGPDYLREIVLTDPQLTDDDIDKAVFPDSLKKLYITPSRITHQGLARLRERYPHIDELRENGLSNQRQLRASSTWQSTWTGQGTIETMSKRKVRSVTLQQVVDPVDLDPLARHGTVERLHLYGRRIRERQWKLSKPLPQLKELYFREVRVNDADLEQLQFTPALETLSMHSSSLSDHAFQHLRHTPNLRVLRSPAPRSPPYDPYGPWITGSGFKHLAKHCSQLEELYLKGSWVQDRFLEDLTPLKSLRQINLDSTRVGDEACRHLARLPALETLQLAGTQVTDQGLRHLVDAPKLRLVTLYGTKTTKEGGQKLRELRPDMTVNQ